SILINGLEELIYLYKKVSLVPPIEFKEQLLKMRNYYSIILHPDRNIAQFNDSALNFSNSQVDPYSDSILCEDSGHARLQLNHCTLIADVGPVAIKENSGHSHSDNLNFELSYLGQRVIIDPGIS